MPINRTPAKFVVDAPIEVNGVILPAGNYRGTTLQVVVEQYGGRKTGDPTFEIDTPDGPLHVTKEVTQNKIKLVG